MPKISLGRVRPVFQGDWDSSRAYEVMDRVRHEGNLFEACENVAAGIEPKKEGSAYWVLLSANSAPPEAKWEGTKLYFEYPDGEKTEAVDLQGPQGRPGDQGAPGTDGKDGREVSITSDYTGTDPEVAFSALGANNLYKTLHAEAQNAQTGAAAAKAAAENAASTANGALTTANAAKTTAETASANASTAKTTAESASKTAGEAKTAATNAGTTANAAKSTADTAKSTADTAKSTADTAKSTADSAKSTASAAQTVANAAIPKSGSRGALAGNETASSLSGSQTITASSADCINLSTSGSVTLTFTAAAATVRAVKAISITAAAATTLTISGAVWANNGEAPQWGDAGKILVLLAHFVGGRVVLSVADNTQ